MLAWITSHYFLWKSLHIISMVCWFAMLFYLPRLFVYHAMAQSRHDDQVIHYFRLMEPKLLMIGHIALIALLISAALLLLAGAWRYLLTGGWLHVKLLLVTLLIAYHIYCAVLVQRFARKPISQSHVFFRWFNEAPALFLISIALLASLKPF